MLKPSQITINTHKTIKALKKDLIKAGVQISDCANDMIDKVQLGKKRKINLIYKTVAELGLPYGGTINEIYKKSKELGLELCPPEIGLYLRLVYLDQPLYEWVFVAMKQISDRRGSPRVFLLGRFSRGLWLRSSWASPDSRWDPRHGFVFTSRKSLRNLDTLVIRKKEEIKSKIDEVIKELEEIKESLNSLIKVK